MTSGFKIFITILILCAAAGISFVALNNANKTQKDKTSVMEAVDADIWSGIN